MNSHPDHTSPMLGHAQFYDDTKLQKRTNFLVSGLLLCFLIAIAALGVSIMVMMQGKERIAQLSIESPVSENSRFQFMEKLNEAQMKIATLQQQVHELQNENKRTSDPFFESIPLPEVPQIEEKPQIEEEPQEKRIFVEEKEEEPSHHHHHEPPQTEMFPEDTEDDVDMYFTEEESSGELTGDDEDYWFNQLEGSGNSACPPFPKPVCPGTYSVCIKGDVCPVFYCCLKDDKVEDNHHHHH